MTFTFAVNAEVDLEGLDHKTKVGNEFLGSIVYRKVVSSMIYDLLVDKLNFLLICSFSTLIS